MIGLLRRNDARRQDRFEMFGAVAVDLDAGIRRRRRAAAGSACSPSSAVSSLVRSRTIAWMALMWWAISSAGTCSRSGACSMMRHRLSAAAPADGKPNVAASPLMSWAARNSSSRLSSVKPSRRTARMRGREPVGLDRHPVLEFARQPGERLFRARDGIVEVGFGNAQQHLAQRIGLRDHVVVGEGLDLASSRAFLSP